MADSYLIDGYNLIHALGMIDRQLAAKALEQARRRLLDFLKDSFGDGAPKVTVVFDAKHAPRHVAREQTCHGLHVQFAPSDQSADDLIEILIDANSEPVRLVVISNDARLQQAARRRGARAWTDADLLDFLEKGDASNREKPDPASEERRTEPLTAEEEKHWTKEFKDLESDPELKEFFDLDRFEE